MDCRVHRSFIIKFRFNRCIERGDIVRILKDSALIKFEISEAEYDLLSAVSSFERGDFKWAVIQGYYSQLHSLRALVYSKGYREKSHICLLHAVDALLADEGIIDREIFDNFSFAMKGREGPLEGCVYTEESGSFVINSAKMVLSVTKNYIPDCLDDV